MPVRPKAHRPRKPETKQHSTHDRERLTSTERGYGYRWQKARKGYLANHPLCAECERKRRVAAAVELDHIIPHKGDMNLFWDRSNWQGLCRPCHSTKTAREDGGFGNPVKRGQGGGG